MTEYDYDSWKAQIRSEIEAWEGDGPPSNDELWDWVAFEGDSVSGWVRDMPATKQSIRTAKGDVLQALVALEMLEERVNDE
jgi:hypothetical protein